MKLTSDAIERIKNQLSAAELGDPRRSRRLAKFGSKIAASPSSSIPLALEEDAEIQAAYRLLNNARVTFQSVLEPHVAQVIKNAKKLNEVILIHDTTDCSFPNLDPSEIGYLQTGKAGFWLHVTLALDGEGWRRPLGVIHAEPIFRSQRRRRPKGARRLSGAETRKQVDNEYKRWWRGIENSSELLAGVERVIHVADRESDSYELMAQTVQAKQDFVFRLKFDRRGRIAGTVDGWSKVKEVARDGQGVLEREVTLSRRKQKSAPGIVLSKSNPPRKARMAKLSFSVTRVVLARPNYLQEPIPETLELNVVRVIEVDPPEGESAVEWLLYTSLVCETNEQIADIVDKYRSRWTIEEFNCALKTGCAYEEREFESRDALLIMLALSLPIACELLWLRSQARSNPELPASEVLSPVQIKVLRALGKRKVPDNPNAQEVLFAVAGLGGHLKRNGPPGWVVLYRGMQKLKAYETGWRAAELEKKRAATCDVS